MKRRCFLIGWCIAISVLFISSEIKAENLKDEFQPDGHTLFLCHYNSSLDAGYSKGDPKCFGNASLTKGEKGKFGEAVVLSAKTNEYTFIPLGRGFIKYETKDNLNQKEGTIEFCFFLFKEPKEFPSPARVTFLNCAEKPDRCLTAFFESKKDGVSPFHFWVNNMPDWKKRTGYVTCAFSMDKITKETWYHLAMSWDKKNIYLFLDGKLESKKKANMEFPPIAPKIQIGGLGFEGLIDELRISDICRYREDFNPRGRNEE